MRKAAQDHVFLAQAHTLGTTAQGTRSPAEKYVRWCYPTADKV